MEEFIRKKKFWKIYKIYSPHLISVGVYIYHYMKYIITESQYRYIKESEYSLKLKRRYAMIEEWLIENLPMLEFDFYDLDDEKSIMMYVINYFLEQIEEYDYLFDEFHEIPQQEIIDFIFDNFKDIIMNYVKED